MLEILVVDCSVAAKLVLDETDRVQALRLLQEEKTGKVSLISPDLLLAEFASLLAKRTRRKQISLPEWQGQADIPMPTYFSQGWELN